MKIFEIRKSNFNATIPLKKIAEVIENEFWKGLHPDHDNLKFMEKDFWKLTEIPIGSDFIGVCYINK